MRLSSFSDYSLRVLMYLGVHGGRLATIGEIAVAYDISVNHLTKVVNLLGHLGYIETVRGKGGGIRLGRAATEIRLGDVIRQTENDFAMVECFATGSHCRIHAACRLPQILDEALAAMFAVLDRYTLADLLQGTGELGRMLPQPVAGQSA